MADVGVTMATVASSLSGVRSIVRPDVVVTSITHDSRKVREGTLFVAVVGMSSDGHDFIDAAVAAGASGILVDRACELDVAQIIVDDTREAMAWAARAVYGEPDTALSIVGITGTNGKTTVAHMCESIWAANGWNAGMIGTLGARIAGEPVHLERTTPEATDLQELLAAMRDAAVDAVAMEVSSHAMELHRADAIVFDIAAFTNLSQDHLDFHGDMESYYAAKASLFVPERARRCVINIDDPYGERLAATVALDTVTVGSTADANVQISDVTPSAAGTSFTLTHAGGEISLGIPLIGSFNVDNAAVAAAIAIEQGITSAPIVEGLASVPIIPGRMEVIPHSGDFTVVVDYAHTPDAISEVLQAAKVASSGRVIAVIGAAGDRDRDKRALMGAAAVRFADVTIITSDNPRSEDPATIAAEVLRGAESVPGSGARIILDRREAIQAAIGGAHTADIVLILGKGHEQGIEAHGQITPFDDRTEARVALERIRGESL